MKEEIVISDTQNNDLRDSLNGLNIPVSIVWGKNDKIIPSNHSEKLNEKIHSNSNECIVLHNSE